LIQLLFGLLVSWCVFVIFEKSFCLTALRYLPH
jgi:hypothetical protein